MSYMNCPQCHLSVKVRAPYLTIGRCPRCLARRGMVVPLSQSDQPLRVASPVWGPAASRTVAAERIVSAETEPDFL